MFSRFSALNNLLYNTKFKLSSYSIRFITKGGSKKKKSNLESNILKLEKKKLNDQKKDEGSTNKDSNKPEMRRPDLALLVAAGLIGLSANMIFFNYSSMKGVKTINGEELIKEYLLNGEVQRVTLFGRFTQLFIGNISAKVTLHPDSERDVNHFGVVNMTPITLLNTILKTEKELGIPQGQGVELNSDMTDLLLLVASIILSVKAIKFIRGIDRRNTNFKEWDPFMDKKIIDQSVPKAKKITQKPVTPPPPAAPPPNMYESFTDFLVDTKTEMYNEKTDVKFKDVAGLHNAKQEVKEFLDYLNTPGRFQRLGAKLPRGAMLLGPPGCGKTLLVKALANESNVPFFYRGGPDFVDLIGGIGAKRLRNLFKRARENSPCIIFIDEIDAIGKKRGQKMNFGGSDDVDQTLNQLLVEMDGMDPNSGVIVFAATNRADILDPALMRPGRFDRHIFIDFPVLEERKELLSVYLTKLEARMKVNMPELRDRLALQTPGMTGADIANLCNEAALTAAKLDYTVITDECFDIALERIIAGAAKKNKILSEKERKIVAYSEAGKILVGWMLEFAEPILKVSIVPRTNSNFGFTQLNSQEKYLETTDVLIDRITTLLGGRAAESLIFNTVTSGSYNDLRKVKKIAFHMVRELGMSEKVGHLSFSVNETQEAYESYPYSKNTRELIDVEAHSIISSAYKRAESIMRNNKDKLELIAKELLAKEVLKFTDIETLIGPRPHCV